MTVLALVALVGAAGWAAVAYLTGSSLFPASDRAQATPSIPAAAEPQNASSPVTPSAVSATCESPPSRDGGGDPVSYQPANVADGQYDTAWRCDGNGVGQRLEIGFTGPVTVTGIGIVPGYAKTDAYDSTDRYAQNRRISAVRYTFDDGSSVTKDLNTSADFRSLQTVTSPGVRTSQVTITILDTAPGQAVNDQPAVDKFAVSEIVVSAR